MTIYDYMSDTMVRGFMDKVNTFSSMCMAWGPERLCGLNGTFRAYLHGFWTSQKRSGLAGQPRGNMVHFLSGFTDMKNDEDADTVTNMEEDIFVFICSYMGNH